MTPDELQKYRNAKLAKVREGITEDALQALMEIAASKRQSCLERLADQDDPDKANKERGAIAELKWWTSLRSNLQPREQ